MFIITTLALLLAHLLTFRPVKKVLVLKSALGQFVLMWILAFVCGIVWFTLSLACLFETESFTMWNDHKVCSLTPANVAFGILTFLAAYTGLMNFTRLWLAVSYPSNAPHYVEKYDGVSWYLILPFIVFVILAFLFPLLTFWFTLPFILVVIFWMAFIMRLLFRTMDEFRLQPPPDAAGLETDSPKYKAAESASLDSQSREIELNDVANAMKRVLAALIIMLIWGITSFALMSPVYSWEYEISSWNRPSHWFFRLTQITLLVLFWIVLFHCERIVGLMKDRMAKAEEAKNQQLAQRVL